MKKTRKAHLWIGLIASLFIFFEALTGLLMSEPWLIGQSGRGGFDGGSEARFRGNFPQGQINAGQDNQGQFNQGQQASDGMQANGDNGQFQNGFNGNGQSQGQNGLEGNRQFNRNNQTNGGTGFFQNRNQNSIMGIIRGLHQGRIGTTNIKWLIDLAAIAMMALTATGIYLSINVLRTEKRRKNRQSDNTGVI
jgi:hypothetical protein